jgi:hypothetical protein
MGAMIFFDHGSDITRIDRVGGARVASDVERQGFRLGVKERQGVEPVLLGRARAEIASLRAYSRCG